MAIHHTKPDAADENQRTKILLITVLNDKSKEYY